MLLYRYIRDSDETKVFNHDENRLNKHSIETNWGIIIPFIDNIKHPRWRGNLGARRDAPFANVTCTTWKRKCRQQLRPSFDARVSLSRISHLAFIRLCTAGVSETGASLAGGWLTAWLYAATACILVQKMSWGKNSERKRERSMAGREEIASPSKNNWRWRANPARNLFCNKGETLSKENNALIRSFLLSAESKIKTDTEKNVRSRV